jgi:hypothetical protein
LLDKDSCSLTAMPRSNHMCKLFLKPLGSVDGLGSSGSLGYRSPPLWVRCTCKCPVAALNLKIRMRVIFYDIPWGIEKKTSSGRTLLRAEAAETLEDRNQPSSSIWVKPTAAEAPSQ